MERIIIHTGILQNSCEIHAKFPAARQDRQISRANISCVMRGNIFHGRSIYRYHGHVDVSSLDCRLEVMSLIAE